MRDRLLCLTLILGLAHWCLMAAGPAGGLMTINGFKTRGQRQDGTRPWELTGARATLQGDAVRLETFNAIFFSEGSAGDVVMKSPHCLYSRLNKMASSEAPLKVKAENFTLSGVGYDLNVAEQRLFVRSNVHMTFKTGMKPAPETEKPKHD